MPEESIARRGGPRARQVRVALVGCSGLLGDIIARTLSHEQDLVVVVDVQSPPVPGDLPDVEADVLVWNGADDTGPPAWLDRLGRDRCPRVLATVSDGRDASLWELVPRRTDLGPLSPATLVETLRSIAGGDEGVA